MARVLSLGYVSFRQMRTLVPPFPPVGSVAAPFGSPAVPHLPRYYGVVRLLAHPSVAPFGRPSGTAYLPTRALRIKRRRAALLGSWAIPLEACPGLGTPATPARPRHIGRCRVLPSAGIKASASQRENDFGAESSRPASLLCMLRTHQSPGEWQHSLLTRLLNFGQAGLAPAGLR